MNLCKRACLYSIRKKGKTLTLLAFLLVMATLMLTCLSINRPQKRPTPTSKRPCWAISPSTPRRWKNGIPEDTVSQILAVDGLSGRYTLRSYTYATYLTQTGTFWKSTPRALPRCRKVTRTPGKIVANSNSQNDSYFTDGGFEMVEGSPITTETGNQVLIHEKFAQRNGLSVGDTMLLGMWRTRARPSP